MALILSNSTKTCIRLLEDKVINFAISVSGIRERHKLNPPPKLRNPTWFTEKNRKSKDEHLTPENIKFLKEVVQDRFVNQVTNKEIVTNVQWKPNLQRTGLIARKIGVYPLWLKNGKKISTTLLQVLDNHVIKYYTPESYNPPRPRPTRIYNKKGCLLLGAESSDPSNFTREYCGLFKDSGVMPKKTLARFFVSPDAAIPPGTLLNALHFTVGHYVDIRGLTIDRGFQGVMKRHGFSGMPASHGVTKTHRRGGNIGGGGEKGRVWPGTKMPGHMGNRWITLRGLKIWRINTKYNVLYVSGQNVPGKVNSLVYVYDTKLWLKRTKDPLPFPTYFAQNEDTPEDIYDETVHIFKEPSIAFDEPGN